MNVYEVVFENPGEPGAVRVGIRTTSPERAIEVARARQAEFSTVPMQSVRIGSVYPVEPEPYAGQCSCDECRADAGRPPRQYWER